MYPESTVRLTCSFNEWSNYSYVSIFFYSIPDCMLYIIQLKGYEIAGSNIYVSNILTDVCE